MSDEYRVLVVPKNDKMINELKLFRFDKFVEPILLAISQDFSQLYKIVQIEGTSTKNSWFFGDHIIRDGRMFGLLPILKGWMFLSLYADLKKSFSSSSFRTISDILETTEESCSNNESENPLDRYNQHLIEIYTNHRQEIESFLSKLMPFQNNLEGDLEFNYNELKIVDSLEKIIETKVLSEESLPVNKEIYLKSKWIIIKTENINILSIALILENLQFFLPKTIFDLLCERFKLKLLLELNTENNDENNPNKHLKLLNPETLILKPIKPSSSSTEDSSLIPNPTSDYSKFNGTLRPEKAKNSKFAVVGNTSMLSFFKKS